MKKNLIGCTVLCAFVGMALLLGACDNSSKDNDDAAYIPASTESGSSGTGNAAIKYSLNYSIYNSSVDYSIPHSFYAAVGINSRASGFSKQSWPLEFELVDQNISSGTAKLSYMMDGTKKTVEGPCTCTYTSAHPHPEKYTFTLNGSTFVGIIQAGTKYWDIEIYDSTGTNFLCFGEGRGGITPGSRWRD